MSLWNITRSRGELMPFQMLLALIGVWFAVYTNTSLVWLWTTLGMFIFFNVVLVEAYLHRYCTHRSYEMHPWVEKILAFFAAVVPGTGSPAGWAALHTAHHRHSDTERDPHSCWYTSFWKLATWQYPYTGTMKSSRRLLEKRHHRWLHQYYVLYMILWAVLVYFLLGLSGLIFIVLLPWGLAPLFSTIQNYFLHCPLPGNYRSYDTNDHSQNTPLMHFLSFGACGLHNTHHAKPTAWNTAEKWWEFDTAAWFIRIVKRKKQGNTETEHDNRIVIYVADDITSKWAE